MQTAIFAANGAARHRLVRAAIVAGFALLAAWAIALALGVMGGFGSLPMLPSGHSHDSNAGSAAHAPTANPPVPAQAGAVQARRAAAAVQTRRATSGSRTVPVRHATPVRTPPQKQKATGSSNSGATHVSTSSGKSYGTTRTTLGKPTGTPGNAAGGSGAPGRLR